MGELSFDHRCDTNDIAIARHTSTVRDVLRSTPLLDTIQSAHAYQRDSTEKPEPINNFFLDAGGQDGSDDESARTDSESQHSSESEDNQEEQDRSENSGDDSSPPLSPTDDDEWE